MPDRLRDPMSRNAHRARRRRDGVPPGRARRVQHPGRRRARADGLAAPEGAQLLQQRRRPGGHERPVAAARLLADDPPALGRRLPVRSCDVGGDAMKLRDRVAVVTGSASGFGRTTAAPFAGEGAKVVVVDVDEAGAAETVQLVKGAGSDGELVVADVATAAGAEHAVSTAEARWGRVDILVNNAGIVQGTWRDTWDCDEETWDRVLRVNLRSVYVCTRAAIPRMIARGGGSIVSVASIAASVCVGGAAYAASKAGILG